MTRKEPKKSETLEVRVPWRLKQDFMARARREGRSASEIIRDLMQDYVRRPAQRTPTQTLETAMTVIRRRPAPAFAVIVAAAGISALLAGGVPAGAESSLHAAFDRLDTNGDGVLSREELIGDSSQSSITNYDQRPGPDGGAARRASPSGPLLLPYLADAGERRLKIVQTVEDGDPLAGGYGPPESLMAEFANADGAPLTREAFIERLHRIRDRSFAALDANGDGIIDAAEMQAAPDPAVRDALLLLDADGDGRITRVEYAGIF